MRWSVRGNPFEPGPDVDFRISVRRPGYVLDINRLAISPRSAAKLDAEAFLAFADEVAAVALKVRGERSQLSMFKERDDG